MFQHVLRIVIDLGTDLQVFVVKPPQAIAAVLPGAGSGVIPQQIEELIQLLELLLLEESRVLQKLSQVCLIAIQILLEESVGKAVKLISEAARAKNLFLAIEPAPSAAVLADERALQQILVNLLQNAVKFTPDGGRITVRSRSVGDSINIYVADTNNNRVQKFSSAGTALGVYGKQGKAPEGGSPRFLGPTAVAVDVQGNIYVADTFNSRIEKLSPSGAFVWQTPLGGQPRGVAVDAQGNVYATSYYNQQVRKFDSAGKLITLWGGRGRTNGLFLGPAAIAVDKSGRVYVADTGNSRVSIFSLLPDGSYGYSGQFGGAGGAAGQFSALGGIAVAQDDTVYAVDTGGHRVQKFNPFGAPFKSWIAAAQLQSVAGLALDGSGHVIVVDSQSNRVGVYSAAGSLIRQLP